MFLVNGQTEAETTAKQGGAAEELPFIVIAATENDDPTNEAFIPRDDSKPNKPGFNLLPADYEDDIEVIEAAGDDSGEPRSFIPTNNAGSDRPGFKLLTPEDLDREASDDSLDVVVIEAGDNGPEPLDDIPRDTSGPNEPFFKLPLPDEGEEDEYADAYFQDEDDERNLDANEDEYDDIVIIEAGAPDEEPRSIDIPRDHSGPNNPGFKLPLPDDELEDDFSDVVVVEAGDDGSSVSKDIPRDDSGADSPFFKLPLPDEGEEDEYAETYFRDEDDGRSLKADDDEGLEDVVIIEVGDDDDDEETLPRLPDCFAEKDPGPCLNSHKSWYYNPTQNQCEFFIYSGCGGNTNR